MLRVGKLLRVVNCYKRTRKLFSRQKHWIHRIVQPGLVSSCVTVPTHIKIPNYDFDGVENALTYPSTIQVEEMRESCQLARHILDSVAKLIQPGVTTDYLDRAAHHLIINNNAYPSPLHYRNFPKSICTSVNNVVCHGIPDDQELHDGDIINIDVTVYYHGHHGDVSETYLVGQALAGDLLVEKLLNVTRHCLHSAISVCGPGVPYSLIGSTIESQASAHGLQVVPEFCGHGIGRRFHTTPEIYHCANDINTDVMKEGVTFTIEPILCEGSTEFYVCEDGWTAMTHDGSRTAQFEHTLLVTEHGVQILT